VLIVSPIKPAAAFLFLAVPLSVILETATFLEDLKSVKAAAAFS